MHQRAADGEHLLLAAAQGACLLASALPQARKAREDPFDVLLDRSSVPPRESAHQEIVPDATPEFSSESALLSYLAATVAKARTLDERTP